jgi:hypothetical protein
MIRVGGLGHARCCPQTSAELKTPEVLAHLAPTLNMQKQTQTSASFGTSGSTPSSPRASKIFGILARKLLLVSQTHDDPTENSIRYLLTFRAEIPFENLGALCQPQDPFKGPRVIVSDVFAFSIFSNKLQNY